MSLGITVTFSGNGGGVPSPSSVLYTPPCAYGTLPSVSRDGYRLLGWFTEASGGTQIHSADAVSDAGGYTVYAQWEVIVSRLVTFDAVGGTVSPSSAYYPVGEAYGSLPTPTLAGFAFGGWWTGVEETYPSCRVDGETVGPDGAHTLYAHWEEETEDDGASEYWTCTPDNEWVYVDAEVVAQNLPSGLQEDFDAWLDDGRRMTRLQFIVDGVVQDFRKAVAAGSHSVGAGDPSLIPLPCHRAAQMMVWYFLGVDCGYAGAEALRIGWQDAEVYLRSLYTASRMGANRFEEGAASGSGLPRYSRSGAGSSVSGGSSAAGAVEGGGDYSSDNSGYISLGL